MLFAGIGPEGQERLLSSRAAIVGCGAMTAVGGDVEALRSALHTNASGLRPAARFDSPRFQSNIVGAASPKDTGSDDPAWQLATEALREARQQVRIRVAATAAGPPSFHK